MSNVTVIDYGIGNLHSVVKALKAAGADVEVATSPQRLGGAERLVLPGVGAFGDGMRELEGRGFVEPLRDFARSGRPFLGICVGAQVMLDGSDEFGDHSGLGIIPGRVEALAPLPGLKVPHVGWNRLAEPVSGAWAGTPLADLPPAAAVYFVHTFAPVPARREDVLCETTYGPHRFASAIRRGYVIGCQFHPEKSGEVGLSLLRGFLRW